MKNIFALFTLLFAAMSATAQTSGQKEVISDSSWIANRAGVFYQARYTVYSTGEESTTLTPLGDTAQTVTRFTDFFRSEAARLAGDANIVRGYRQTVTELLRLGRTLPGLLGKSPLDSLRNTEPNLLQTSQWQLSAGANSTGLRFRVTAAGAFQWRADTTTNWRSAGFIGDIVRLNSLNGYTTDFYRSGKSWRTINGQYIIRPIASRSLTTDTDDDPEPQPAPEPEPEPKTVLNSDGTVSMPDGRKYKYNSRAKKWGTL